MNYTKPPLTIQQQAALLKSRGMVIDDEPKAEFYLSHINYYRLRAYCLPFEQNPLNPNHAYIANTRFEDVLNLYDFDRQLRILLLDAIERIEVSVQTTWAYTLAHEAGSHAYLDLNLFNAYHQGTIQKIREEVNRSQETFIRHYKNTYSQPPDPPIWAVCEVMSFGAISKSFSNLTDVSIKDAIADTYGFEKKVFQSLLHHLTYLRNLCAHHNRVWNRQFTVGLRFSRNKPQGLAVNFNQRTQTAIENEKSFYNTAVMIIHLVELVDPNSTWKLRLKDLIHKHQIDTTRMGFPSNWLNLPIWQT